MTEKADNTAARVIQFTGDNHREVLTFVGRPPLANQYYTGVCVIDRENRVSLDVGDWAVRNEGGQWIRVSEDVAGVLAEKVVRVEVPKTAMHRMMHPGEMNHSWATLEEYAERYKDRCEAKGADEAKAAEPATQTAAATTSPLGNNDQAELDAALYDLKRIAENVIGKWLTKQILHVARSAVATMMDRGLAAGIRRFAEATVNVHFTSWFGETLVEPKARKAMVEFADKTVDRINNWLARQ